MELIQKINEVVDVSNWRVDDEFGDYPEGARDKSMIYCPNSSYEFLIPGHRYLFKLSSRRYPEQFWIEIFAYRLGITMGVPVPPAFVAYDSGNEQAGALIEWFLKKPPEDFIAGGDYCQEYILNFDRKKGKKHNFETIIKVFDDLIRVYPNSVVDWKEHWAKTFVFDALIGNTDRHQDNWGVVINSSTPSFRIAPVFDNGTSLGHEILENNIDFMSDYKRLERYISKGRHHIKWACDDALRMGHLELLQTLSVKIPETKQVMLDCLRKVNTESFESILDNLMGFEVPVRLSIKRVGLMLKLLKMRHQHLLSGLEN